MLPGEFFTPTCEPADTPPTALNLMLITSVTMDYRTKNLVILTFFSISSCVAAGVLSYTSFLLSISSQFTRYFTPLALLLALLGGFFFVSALLGPLIQSLPPLSKRSPSCSRIALDHIDKNFIEDNESRSFCARVLPLCFFALAAAMWSLASSPNKNNMDNFLASGFTAFLLLIGLLLINWLSKNYLYQITFLHETGLYEISYCGFFIFRICPSNLTTISLGSGCPGHLYLVSGDWSPCILVFTNKDIN